MAQKDNPDARWSVPDDFNVVFTDAVGELTVGGVFLRLYIANPGWVLRKPKEFIVELLEKWSSLVSLSSPDGEVLETVTSAIVAFFAAQPSMLDSMPQLGHIPKIFRAMANRNDAIPKTAILIVHQFANSEVLTLKL